MNESSPESTLAMVQRESNEWRERAYPDTAGLMYQALGANEEVSEIIGAMLQMAAVSSSMGMVTHAVLKNAQGIRGYSDMDKVRSEVADGISDVIIFLCGVASKLDIDIDAAVGSTWEYVKARNIRQGSDNSITVTTDEADVVTDAVITPNTDNGPDHARLYT